MGKPFEDVLFLRDVLFCAQKKVRKMNFCFPLMGP